jgi:hypothetical protein
MKDFKADAGLAKADAGYVQADNGYDKPGGCVPLCPADGSAVESVSIRIETIDNSPQNYSIYRCTECKRYLAGGNLVDEKSIIGNKQAAAKLLNELRHPDEPYTASEIVIVEES